MWKVEDVLPHRKPMILLDNILQVDFEKKTLTADFQVKDDNLFFDKKLNGICCEVALEYMAQAIGCMAGIYDLSQTPPQKPKVGFVLGSRRIEHFIDHFEYQKIYQVKIKELFFDENLASFDCFIYDSMQQVVCSAVLNAYRPDNINEFMENYQ